MIDFDFKGGFMNLKGIIFDMDGVIVDTEYQDFLIQKDFIKHLNPKSSYEDSELLVLVGKSYFNHILIFIGFYSNLLRNNMI